MRKRTDANSLIASLSPEKRALLARKLKQQARGQGATDYIPRRDDAASFQPSFTQQQMCFVEQLFPGNPVYNRPGAVRISGPVVLSVLQEALNAVIRRHAILRARLVDKQGVLEVVIEEQLSLPIPLVDLEGVAENAKTARISSLYRKEAQKPFDLRRGPLVRATLVRADAQQHLLFLMFHHAVYDAWSMGVLLHELVALYEAYETNAAPELPELPIQYSDYAAWYREQAEAGRYADQLDYWKRTLADAAPLALPSDYPRPAVQTAHGASYLLEVPGAVVRSLRHLATQENATLFILLLGVFQVLLQRYSGQDDITVASPVAGRTQLDTEKLIGVFVNTLLFRSQVPGSASFRQFLARLRNTAMDAYSNQALPFDRLVEALQPARDLSRNPLFQVMFQLRTLHAVESGSGHLRMEEVKLDAGIALVDLILDVVDSGDGLQCVFVYNTDLFEASHIERLGMHYVALLEGVVADPDCQISALPMLSPAERRRLLVDWNDTHRPYPRERCIHELFEQQVERTPQAIAVEHQGRHLSYGELNARADRLAAYLHARGVDNETLVGLCVERSPEMVVGMLGILKAGGAYVPLDPDYPRARLALMLEDTGAPVLLTQARLEECLPEYGGERICLDSDWDRIAGATPVRPRNAASAQSLAYVIYTSGSTGQPKGVCVPHRAVNRLVINTDYVCLGPDDRIAQVANIAFDAATFEVWGALLCGGALHIIEQDVFLSPKTFAARLKAQGITTLFLTTALFNQYARDVPDAFRSLRQVLFGGEKVDPRCVKAVLNAGPPRRLLHVYGPTENTTFTSWYEVKSANEHAATIPIGKAIANTRLYVLDDGLNPVTAGVQGELYIGGDGLARGYLNRDDLTAEAFVANPFSECPDERLYKTGDLVRYVDERIIEFAGRGDQQLKLRGFRIEPGEIETALRGLDGVQDAIVVMREDRPGDKRLVAYVVIEKKRIRVQTVRARLKKQLPEFMLPSTVVAMDKLPLSPNGKVDRNALPEPPQMPTTAPLCVPKDFIEVELTKLWKQVLGLTSVRVTDNFFELGGYSLLGVHLFAEVEKKFGKQLPLAALFEHPTIESMATLLRGGEWSSRGKTIVAVQPEGARAPFFCVHGRADLLAKYLDREQPLYWLHHAQEGANVDYTSIESVAANHIQDIRKYQQHGPYYLGGYSFGGVVAFEMARQLQQDGEQVAMLALIDPTSPRWRNSLGKTVSYKKKKLFALIRNDNVSGGEKLKMAGEIAIGAARRTIWKLNKQIECIKYRVNGVRGQALTVDQKKLRLIDLFKKAARAYQYQEYSGHTVLFVHSRDRHVAQMREQWGNIVSGSLKIQVVDGVTGHLRFFREPYVVELARQLNDHLQKCQASVAAGIDVPPGNLTGTS
jgi:amino acid adenylation domain-containing protein